MPTAAEMPWPSEPGGHVDARGVIHVGMALQVAADVAQRLEILLGEESALGEHGVQARRAVTLGKHEAVAVGLAGSAGSTFISSKYR